MRCAARQLERVSGIGPAKAAELYEKHKVLDLPMLVAAADAQPSLLTAEQRLGPPREPSPRRHPPPC